MRIIIILINIVSLAFVSCSRSASGQSKNIDLPPTPECLTPEGCNNPKEDNNSKYREIEQKVTESLQSFSDCFEGNQFIPSEGCLVDLKYSTISDNSNSKKILIFDSGMDLVFLSRLRGNTLGVYNVHNNGELKKPYIEGQKTDYQFPAPFFDILTSPNLIKSKLTAASFYKLFPSKISSMKNFLAEKYSYNDYINNHGQSLAVKVHDLIPNSQFLFVQRNELDNLPIELFCNIDNEEVLQSVERFYTELSYQLRDKVVEYDIDFVHVASSTNINRYTSAWAAYCPNSQLPKKDVIRKLNSIRESIFLNVADNNKKVIVFQSTSKIFPFSELPNCSMRPHNHIFLSFTKRLFLEDDLPVISEQGEEASLDLLGDNFNLTDCNTIFYSLDAQYEIQNIPGINQPIFVPFSTLMPFDHFGFGADLRLGGAYIPVSSSFVPPIAIADWVFQQNLGLTNEEILNKLLERPVRAPQRYGNFPVCKTDKRLCESMPNLTPQLVEE